MSLSAALETGDVTLLPGRRDEDWRWTDLRGLLRSLPPPAGDLHLEALSPGPFDHLTQDVQVLHGGASGAAIEVGPGEALSVGLRVVSRGESSLNAHGLVRVGAGGRLRLFETYEGDDGAYVSSVSLRFELGVGAAVERIVLCRDGASGVLVSQAEVSLSNACEFGQSVFTTGARRQRIETRVQHPGQGSTVRLDGAYLLYGQRRTDLTTEVRHLGPGGLTQQLAKGVVRDQARAVFQGRIVVEAGADQTEARMGHHALLLSDKAEVDAKPELLINADDVQCAHGNTIGALDDECLFYMRQRGLPEDVARNLLIEAFVAEVTDRVWNVVAREHLRDDLLPGMGRAQ